MPIRIQRKRTKGWKMPPNTVSVTRHGRWGNPFTIGCDPSGFSVLLPSYCDSNKMAVDCFRYYINKCLMVNEHFLDELRGKNLACWCKDGEPCHADVLLELANT